MNDIISAIHRQPHHTVTKKDISFKLLMCGIYKKRDTYHHAEQRAEKAQAYPKMDAGVSLETCSRYLKKTLDKNKTETVVETSYKQQNKTPNHSPISA